MLKNTLPLMLIAMLVTFLPRHTDAAQAPEKAEKKAADTASAVQPENGNMEITARLLEIPGKMPPNDLYNYVYILKYRVISVEKGQLAEKEILVGQYNPLIPRDQIKDKMDPHVAGNVTRFEAGQKHRLVLSVPLTNFWDGAVEDDYFDEETVRYFALQTDTAE